MLTANPVAAANLGSSKLATAAAEAGRRGREEEGGGERQGSTLFEREGMNNIILTCFF
jgi:hypothetical protein